MTISIQDIANIPAPSLASVIGVYAVTTASSAEVDTMTAGIATAGLTPDSSTIWTFQADGADVWVLFTPSPNATALNTATLLNLGTANGGAVCWKIPNGMSMPIPMGPKRRYFKTIGSANATLRIMKDGG